MSTTTTKRRKRAEHVKSGKQSLGLIEWHEPTIGSYPYHVTIQTPQGPQYLGVVSTLTAARRVVRDNT